MLTASLVMLHFKSKYVTPISHKSARCESSAQCLVDELSGIKSTINIPEQKPMLGHIGKSN